MKPKIARILKWHRKASARKGLFIFINILLIGNVHITGQENIAEGNIDSTVISFLESRMYRWRDMNIPYSDGHVLYDLIMKNHYTRALEIGTSTGHSAIWIAWALSKTGGRLITVEIDEGRYKEAVENFREAGVAGFIDARLADARELVPALDGPFDFVFCDADKNWYKQYFMAILPKLTTGGCFAAHNVGGTRGYGDVTNFLEYVRKMPNMETVIIPSSKAGISVSIKIR